MRLRMQYRKHGKGLYMTKKTGLKISIIIAAVFFISASKPSLDGRALVASPGELPPGLYVKAAAFLPGDTVLITNPAAKVSIEALVFGTFSPSEGVAVVLSPQAADLLFITKDSNSIIQLTKSGRDTERSVLAKAFDAVPVEKESADKEDDSVLYEDYVKAEAGSAQESPSETAFPAEDTGREAEPEDIPETEHILDDEQVFTPFADNPNAENKTMQDAEFAEKPQENIQENVEESLPAAGVSESVYEEPVVETAEAVPESEVIPEDKAAPENETTPEDENASENEAEPEAAVEDAAAPAEEAVFAAGGPLIEKSSDEATEPDSSETAAESELEPNILIAAEDNPPAGLEDAGESVITDALDNDALPDYFTYSQEDEIPFAEKPLYDEHFDFDTASYLIDSLSVFGTGTYCIQLATYKNKAYITDVIKKYADKYPVRLLKSEKIPEAYQVLIGPLNKDEYPVILKRFVARGFKDAFLRTVR